MDRNRFHFLFIFFRYQKSRINKLFLLNRMVYLWKFEQELLVLLVYHLKISLLLLTSFFNLSVFVYTSRDVVCHLFEFGKLFPYLNNICNESILRVTVNVTTTVSTQSPTSVMTTLSPSTSTEPQSSFPRYISMFLNDLISFSMVVSNPLTSTSFSLLSSSGGPYYHVVHWTTSTSF